MKIKIALLALLISCKISGQIQKEFFVNDVQTIEYVTVNFCVNDNAEIAEVKVVPDKTTYQNKNNIEMLLQYLLSIEFYSDSKLKNNCHESTFEFINQAYPDKTLNMSECEVCTKFKTGLYAYIGVLNLDTKIKRKRKVQREISDDSKQIYYIKWLNNCTYVLIYKRMTEPRLKHLIGKEIHVEIIDVLEDDRYAFRAKPNFKEKVVYGVIKKVK